MCLSPLYCVQVYCVLFSGPAQLPGSHPPGASHQELKRGEDGDEGGEGGGGGGHAASLHRGAAHLAQPHTAQAVPAEGPAGSQHTSLN